jgi:hypothetical protein
MANFIAGIISLVVGIVMFANVFMTTVKGTNTTAWTASEIAMWGLLGLLGIIGIAYGVMQVFGLGWKLSMNLNLFGLLLGVSVVLIIIGLARPRESAQALVGFLFLFILSMVMVSGAVQYDTGANVSSTYSYDASNNVIATNQAITYSYANFNDSTSHNIGIYLAITSALGFIGVMVGLAGGLRKKDD